MTTCNWPLIIAEAEVIARSYTTAVTLRQLHYRLVAAAVGGYTNTQSCYKRLSSLTAEARRCGTFPQLSDRTRGVHQVLSFADPADAIRWVTDRYRRDRTEGQEYQIWVIYEKATLGAQIEQWVLPYGLPSAALRGYSSESLEREAFEMMENEQSGYPRPIVVFYVGDLDPEGEDIERNFLDQAERWGIEFDHWQRLTVLPEQIAPMGLVPQPGKTTSSRAPGFVAKYGRLFQIETEAVDPAVLESLIVDAITDDRWFDPDALDACNEQMRLDRERLEELAEEEAA